MKKLLVLFLILAFVSPVFGYPKTALVERFTNTSCGPCASINNAWYVALVGSLEDQGYLNHIVYNVNWPGPNDPMYLLNATDNMTRRGYYGVNSVPWIEIDGDTFERTGNNNTDADNFTNIILTTFATGYAPFQIELTPEIYINNTMDIHVTVTRDPNDTMDLPETVTLQIGLEENVVNFDSPPGSNGETTFHDVCRKMIYNANGMEMPVPEPGESFETTLLYIPSQEAMDTVDFSLARVLAFIQNDETREVYQSKKVEPTFSDHVHAAFRTAENVGATPFVVEFEDLSTPTNTTEITSWEWDLDGDGTIDSTDPEPVWTYPGVGTYSVTLTVSDGTETHTTTRENYIFALTNQSDILVVNGLEYGTYPDDMADFYNSSAIFGDHQVDVWDLFGDQGFDYELNPDINQVVALQRDVPNSIMYLYNKVIWVGNNYGGDVDYFDGWQVLDYLEHGGNFILATRRGETFLNAAMRQYCGIMSITGDRVVTELVALDNNLVNMSATGDNSLVHLVQLDGDSEAVPIFQETTQPDWVAGFRIQKENEGAFIYVAGRPYRFDVNESYQNYDYMINNWMDYVTAVEDDSEETAARSFQLAQNHPNPFNPSTQIHFSLAQAGHASLKIYDSAGRLIKTLLDENRVADDYTVSWDGRNQSGDSVASGVYFYRLKTDAQEQTRRMVLMK